MAERKIQEYKKESVASLTEEFKGHSDFIFSDYRGMTVEQITELRKRLRGTQAAFRVVKNNFAKIALKSLETPDADALLKGPTAVCYVDGETMPAVKILFEAAKTMPLEVKGGIIDVELDFAVNEGSGSVRRLRVGCVSEKIGGSGIVRLNLEKTALVFIGSMLSPLKIS